MKPKGLIQVVTMIAVIGLGVAFAEEPRGSRAIYNNFTDAEEMAMGRNAAEDVDKTQPILDDPELTGYLDRVGQQVAASSQRKALEYHFKIVNSPSVNAFSLPGGYVYVNRGLMEVVETESELAGVLGHEVGHVVGFHSMNDVARRWLVDRVMYEGKKAGLVQDKEIQNVIEHYGGTALLFVNRKFSREEENEADLLGIYNAERSGWDPSGLITFLNRLAGGSGQDLYQQLLRNHPLPEERVKNLTAELKIAAPAKGLKKTSGAFRMMKERLRTLPPPPPPPERAP